MANIKPKNTAANAKHPEASPEDLLGRVGVHLVGLKVTQELRWTFREKPTTDIGIDGEIEVQENSHSSHGRLIAVQIKCGQSYLKEKTENGYIYRGDYSHLKYWSDFSVPVIVVLCDPVSSDCWWVEVKLFAVNFHSHGWSIEVPTVNRLQRNSMAQLALIAARFQKKDLVELMLRDWIGWSFGHQMKLVSDAMMPRDYHWFSHLGVIGNDDYYMMEYLVADLQGFNRNDLQEILRHVPGNSRGHRFHNFLLFFISESLQHLKHLPEPPLVPGVKIQYVPLLMSFEEKPTLREVGADNHLIDDYQYEYDGLDRLELRRLRTDG